MNVHKKTPASAEKIAVFEREVQHGSVFLRAFKKIAGDAPFTAYRHLRNTLIGSFLTKPALTTKEYRDGLQFWDKSSYQKALAYYLAKHQSFEEYQADPHSEQKEYLDLDFSVYFQCYSNKRATYATLQSFRKFYPNVPILLVSDGGEDFSALARHFNCEYYYDPVNISYWPCTDMRRWFDRIKRACTLFNTEWVLILETDVRTRDRISKYPHAHLSGQGGSRGTRITKQLSPAAQVYIKEKYPETENFGISGCGGSIFHRASFMKCVDAMKPGDIEEWTKLDAGIPASDVALTFLFLVNGYVVRRWLDLSHDTIGNWGPGSAFDHQFKYYYDHPLSEEDERVLATLL